MRLRHIEIFHAIMLKQSISGAADHLHITQSAVSQALQHAELQLGFKLFKKIKQRLIPTANALILYPEIQQPFNQLEHVKRLAHHIKYHADDQLKILIIPSLAQDVFPLALAEFRQHAPDILLDINTHHSKHIIEQIRLRAATIGIIYGDCHHDDITCIPLSENPLVLIEKNTEETPILTSLQPTQQQSLTNLTLHKMIRIDPQDPIGMRLDETCAHLAINLPSTIIVHTQSMAIELVKHGFGAAIVDLCATMGLLHQHVTISSLLPSIPIKISAILHQQNEDHPFAKKFIHQLQKTLSIVTKNTQT